MAYRMIDLFLETAMTEARASDDPMATFWHGEANGLIHAVSLFSPEEIGAAMARIEDQELDEDGPRMLKTLRMLVSELVGTFRGQPIGD